MSAIEVAISVGSAAVGAAAGSLAVYFGAKRQNASPSDSQNSSSDDKKLVSNQRFQESGSIPKGHLEK
ncbi:MAG: hypothetical protein ABSE82_06120, partial [Nitrososphaerales archaeon]